MNAVEIEEAVSDLASSPFDSAAFPYAFLAAFGVKETTIARLRKGDTNASDVGGVLQRGNIHIAVAVPGGVNDVLRALRNSPKTTTAKAKFILATDGQTLEAEDLVSGEPLACAYHKFADHFGFFLPLAGISTVKELKNNPIDVKATGRLNRLYVELLKENAEWGTPERRHDLNQFMARLIFCFFAEDTGIFNGTNLFTSTLERMSTTEAGSVERVLTELFRAMDIAPDKRQDAKLRSWADAFPYVNGGLFAGGKPCPRFSKIARSYLLRAGELNWREINPDIFGSMIQAVADEGERGSLGMHYTSVPNIMKLLGPLFLDDLHAQLAAAGDNARKLRNLRKRLASIRVFDPACGSGNFLVIAYIRMREIEHEIVKKTDDEPRSVIPLSNFYGIEIKDFAAEIARLALLIAEFQCDVRFIDQHIARSLVLPLKRTGQIKTGNALHEDWAQICPGTMVPPSHSLSDQSDDRNEKNKFAPEDVDETFICGNPPYLGGKGQSAAQKNDMTCAFGGESGIGELDYIAAWFIKAALYIKQIDKSVAAFVATNSLNQGSQVHQLWPKIFHLGLEIKFCHRSFKWSNSARNNAAVICNIIGIGLSGGDAKLIFDGDTVQAVTTIGPYLVPNNTAVIHQSLSPVNGLPKILTGNSPYDGGNLLLSIQEKSELLRNSPEAIKFVRPLSGSVEFINGLQRYCLWIDDSDIANAESIPEIKRRIENVRASRSAGGDVAKGLVKRPHQFRYTHTARSISIIVPRVSSASRDYIPFGILDHNTIISDSAQAIYDPDLWVLSIMLSRMHMCWVRTVSGKLKNDIRYASALCYNTFPIPKLTDQDKLQLTMNAESILLSREESFPSTLAEMYDPEKMPEELRRAHENNDETVERIYIGRRFRNDTERLDKLFDLYMKISTSQAKSDAGRKPANRGRDRALQGAS